MLLTSAKSSEAKRSGIQVYLCIFARMDLPTLWLQIFNFNLAYIISHVRNLNYISKSTFKFFLFALVTIVLQTVICASYDVVEITI